MPMNTKGSLLLAFAMGAAGCSSTPKDPPPEKTGPDITPILSGPQIKYVPKGCDYAVTSPAVDDGVVDGKGLATEAPDNIHLGLGGDAATTFAVNWRSAAEATASVLLYGTNADAVGAADDAANGVKSQTGHALFYHGLFDSDSTRIHEVHVCGLQPSTKYFYKVGNKGAWSKVYSVTTAPTVGPSAQLTVAITGDARSDPTVWASIQRAVQTQGAQLQIFSGDAVLTGANQDVWNQFFQTTSGGIPAYDSLASTLFMPVNGNHENLAINYLAQFALPQEVSTAESGEGKEWYSFDYGNIHIISLNDTTASDTILQENETEWLKADLAKVDRAKTPWVFVNHHQPLYSCSKTHGSNETIRKVWQPIYDQYKVDLVINGHVHDYERTKAIRGLDSSGMGIVVPAGEGTTYVVSGGSGAPLYTEFEEDECAALMEAHEATRNYVILNVEAAQLKFTAYRLDGSVLDTFTLAK